MNGAQIYARVMDALTGPIADLSLQTAEKYRRAETGAEQAEIIKSFNAEVAALVESEVAIRRAAGEDKIIQLAGLYRYG